MYQRPTAELPQGAAWGTAINPCGLDLARTQQSRRLRHLTHPYRSTIYYAQRPPTKNPHPQLKKKHDPPLSTRSFRIGRKVHPQSGKVGATTQEGGLHRR